MKFYCESERVRKERRRERLEVELERLWDAYIYSHGEFIYKGYPIYKGIK